MSRSATSTSVVRSTGPSAQLLKWSAYQPENMNLTPSDEFMPDQPSESREPKKDWTHLDRFRKSSGPYASAHGDDFGAFYIYFGTVRIIAIASGGSEEIPWEHVSLRTITHNGDRCPTWD